MLGFMCFESYQVFFFQFAGALPGLDCQTEALSQFLQVHRIVWIHCGPLCVLGEEGDRFSNAIQEFRNTSLVFLNLLSAFKNPIHRH